MTKSLSVKIKIIYMWFLQFLLNVLNRKKYRTFLSWLLSNHLRNDTTPDSSAGSTDLIGSSSNVMRLNFPLQSRDMDKLLIKFGSIRNDHDNAQTVNILNKAVQAPLISETLNMIHDLVFIFNFHSRNSLPLDQLSVSSCLSVDIWLWSFKRSSNCSIHPTSPMATQMSRSKTPRFSWMINCVGYRHSSKKKKGN